jgi:hypothetical protein
MPICPNCGKAFVAYRRSQRCCRKRGCDLPGEKRRGHAGVRRRAPAPPPTPEQIAARAAEIRSQWSEEEWVARAHCRITPGRPRRHGHP